MFAYVRKMIDGDVTKTFTDMDHAREIFHMLKGDSTHFSNVLGPVF